MDATLSKDMGGPVLLHRFRYRLGRGFVKPGETVLDIGCGAGYGTEMLSKVAGKVIGIELSAADVREAEKKYGKPNVEFICGDLEKIELPKCDVACAFEVIEHFHDVPPFIKKLKEATKKFIVLSVPVGQHLVWVEEKKEWQEENDWTHHSAFADENVMRKLFEDDKWKKFFDFTSGITYMGAYYNSESIIQKEDGTYDFC